MGNDEGARKEGKTKYIYIYMAYIRFATGLRFAVGHGNLNLKEAN